MTDVAMTDVAVADSNSWKERARSVMDMALAYMMGSILVVFLIQIVARYALNTPMGWTIEYVAIAWVWGVFLGFAFVLRDEEMLRIDFLVHMVSPGWQRVFDIVAHSVCAVIIAWSIPKSWGYVSFMSIEKTAYMLIPFHIVFAVYIPFAISVVVRSALAVRRAIKGTGYGPALQGVAN
jgi:C4-dicarboxylate transporter, DctQ subunit